MPDQRSVLDRCPLPLARAYRRSLNAAETRERHDAGYFAFEVYLKYAASIAIAFYLAAEPRDHRVNAALKGLARPSLGEWLRFLRECLRFLREGSGKSPDAVAGALSALYESKEARWPEAIRLYNAIRQFLSGDPSEREKVSLAMLLEEVVSYRNRVLGHGAPLGKEHYERFGELLGKAFPGLLQESPYLAVARLVAFDSIQVAKADRIECAVVEYMGLNPSRMADPLRMPYGARPPAKGDLHLLSPDGSFVSLDPLLLAHEEDVYFLNDAEGTPEYLSYSTGERLRPPGGSGVRGKLFERILRYRVDPARLSRIGEDVAPIDAPAEKAEVEAREERLGDFRIVREIGRGAMGTVFEAIQESLGRRVALKVLPGSFALDPKRIERFRREARATARIHHPSIVPVYEVGESGGTFYYAMEYIDGPALSEALDRLRGADGGKPPGSSDRGYIAQAVAETAQLAEGLHQAHRQGLVHRDVKPSNVLVDSTGRHILVDFGLVREEEAETLTRSGEMVGTLGYMSPEQVSRRRVDARSDVYGLAATLYEVLTLRRPFGGETEHEIHTAVLFEEPVPPRKFNPKLSRDLETILLHGLEKNPERRYPSALAFAEDLRLYLEGEPIRARPVSRATRVARRLRRHRAATAAVAASTVVILVALFVLSISRPPLRLVLTSSRSVTPFAGLARDPVLSPDGKLLAYASDHARGTDLDIWIQAVDGSSRRRLTWDASDDSEPAFSPDGRTIAFRSGREGGGIYAVPAAGGGEGREEGVRSIARQGRRPRFSPDGTQVAFWIGETGGSNRGTIHVVPANGGQVRDVLQGWEESRCPIWSPEGTHLLFLGYKGNLHDWWVVPSGGGTPVPTGARGRFQKAGIEFDLVSPCVWAPIGRVLFSAPEGGRVNLWSVKIDAETCSVSAAPERLSEGTGAGEVDPSFGGNRHTAFANLVSNVDVWSLPIDGNTGEVRGEIQRLTSTLSREGHPHVTPDGKLCAFPSDREGKSDIWLRNLETGRESRLTDAAPGATSSRVSPDGKMVAYRFEKDYRSRVILLEAGLPAAPGDALHPEADHPSSWSQAGDQLACCFIKDERPAAIALLTLATKSVEVIVEDPSIMVWNGQLSPDGKRVVFNAIVTIGSSQIFVAPLRPGKPAGRSDWIPVTDGATWDDKPALSPDGNLVYFFSERDGFRCIYAQRLDNAGRPIPGGSVEVKHFHSARQSPLGVGLYDLGLSVARDKLVFNMAETTGSIWMAELEERR